MNLENLSIHAWLTKNKIVNEKGQPIDFRNHLFLFDIYKDFSPYIAVEKAAQIGMSTASVLKKFWLAKQRKLDIIYTLPTQDDVNTFVSGKTNRLIANNPVLQDYTKDKDSIQQKQVGDSMIYYRGTFTQKAAIMVTSDVNIHDEVDSSKNDVVAEYEARLQHSQYGWRWYFSHPSVPNYGVDKYWRVSDQKHWFIKCNDCKKEQYMWWPDSVDFERGIYVCKFCKAEITDEQRRVGRWVAKYERNDDRPFSGYWIPLLIAPWVSAKEIIDKYNDPTNDEEFFYTKVLGLPYVGSGNIVTEDVIIKNLTSRVNDQSGRIVIGCDTGLPNWYVIGNEKGIFNFGEDHDYSKVEGFLKRWPTSIVVFDAQGDLRKPRELQEKYGVGRVFLCYYRKDKKTNQLVTWGTKKEQGVVQADRNRMIQLIVDEFEDNRIPLYGDKSEWYDYYLHWANIYRVEEENSLGVPERKWERKGPDHLVHATNYWRIGMSKFGFGNAKFFQNDDEATFENSYEIEPDDTVRFDPHKFDTPNKNAKDWRQV